MKSQWLFLFLVVPVGSGVIGYFAKDPWRDWLGACFTMGAIYWISMDEWRYPWNICDSKFSIIREALT